ncbi:25S rRNA (uridine-N(3))-methyltransferase [Lachnellula hyalina]|uniref:25S rRNA (Uridine-N(3))-methyltransferase n=1 Tax=Lachnellula hyalina TaxID=1316788 RepID=A0A8H8QTS6_9HELO|nr:25S rRNA (uridine-N(3))-methyltransferase [Lachnellula hyalina]TVY22396.1 25S rRNA (uridine-N(3))-methyltransferase [Lachnellula hyalina]
MGKRRSLTSSRSSKPKPKHQSTAKNSRPAGISKPSQPKKKHIQVSQTTPIIPFEASEKILLVGEGDLSFARCLVSVHKCSNVTATVLEGSEEELVEKYPQARENVDVIRDGSGGGGGGGGGGGVVRFGVDVGKMMGKKMGLGKEGGFERVFFNFPHVGGKSTDVNRQVRYNQELLVSFFTSTLPLLSRKPGSSIIITLFEGAPYTLWNIRDLGRHSGLEVKRSFKFQREVWTGYRHARTLGVVKGKDGKEGAGWKGEERAARMFEFVRKGEGAVQGVVGGKKKGGESSDDEEDVGDGDTSEDLDAVLDLEVGNNDDGMDGTLEDVETDTDDQNESNESDDD